MKKIFIIAGETSGDTHGAELMSALSNTSDDISFSGLGGEKMSAIAPQKIENWLDHAAVLGITEVLRNYSYFRKKLTSTIAQIKHEQPDGVILVDYPGFNLRLARELRSELGEKCPPLIQYICPQVWAWKKGRVKTMARDLDLLLCIFPFEPEIFNQSRLPAKFVGHPLANRLYPPPEPREPNLIALLPGSREREIARIFPAQLQAAAILNNKYPELHFITSATTPENLAIINQLTARSELPADSISTQLGGTDDIMRNATCGTVASGTATLEATLLGLPYCLVYRVHPLTYQIGRRIVDIENLGIANILAQKKIVPELIQADANGKKIAVEIEKLLTDKEYRQQQTDAFTKIRAKLGQGIAADNAAAAIFDLIANNK